MTFSIFLSGCEESRKIIFYNATKSVLYSEIFKESLKNGYQVTFSDEKKGLLGLALANDGQSNTPYQNTNSAEPSNTAFIEFIEKQNNRSVEVNIDFKGNPLSLMQYKSNLLKNVSKKYPKFEIYAPDGKRMIDEEKF